MTNVTKPFLPPLESLQPYLEKIWSSGQLSNSGPLHNELEARLAEYLCVEHVSLFCNATIALMVAQQALDIKGEIITTPYSFVATTHAITWMQNTPVFVDVDPKSLCLNPDLIEAAISEDTAAIMPLHCYGNTCEVNAIQRIAESHNIPVIYDACHSFGVHDDGGGVLRHGDISVVSFHATKVFNTFEGGLLVCKNAETKRLVDQLKNFGYADELTVLQPGINGKMSEFNAAVGLVQLDEMENILRARGTLDSLYRDKLKGIKGIRCYEPHGQARRNYAYFPIYVEDDFALSRDELYYLLEAHGIFGRRYFYPLISEFPMYSRLPSSDLAGLSSALKISREVICLPLFPDLAVTEVERISGLIAGAAN